VSRSAWQPFGDAALWAPRPSEDETGSDALALWKTLRACPGVIDAVVTEERVCVHFDPRHPPPGLERLDQALDRPPVAKEKEPPRDLVLRVHYDGADLHEVAAQASRSPEEVVRLHLASVYVVRMMGFLPGFAYLGGLEPQLVIPRRAVPRPRVEAGSVAIAAEYTAVYPFASPGGWNVIGHAIDAELFRNDTGARLRLGDRVRFEWVE
jgi:UPF0271 protein